MVSAKYASPKMGRAAGLLLILNKLLQCVAVTSKVPAILALHHESPTLLQEVENTIPSDKPVDKISDGAIIIVRDAAEPFTSQQVSGEGLMNSPLQFGGSRNAVQEF